MNNPIFRIKNLDYKNGREIILKINNFEIHRGSCYLFNGEMASGKTLLINILNKTNKKYNGEVNYDDSNLRSISKGKYYNDVSIVHQRETRPYFKTVYKYIYGFICKKNNADKAKKYTNSVIKMMNLKNIINMTVRSLTPSQFRWVDLAAKIGSNPKVLFIDEIEQHLSKENISILSKLLFRKCNYDGVTLICTTQNSNMFRSLASVIITLKHGRISRLRSHTRKNN